MLVEFFVSLGMSILRFGSWTDDLGSVWPKRCGLELNGSRQSLDSSRAFCFQVVDLFLYGLFDDGLFFDW